MSTYEWCECCKMLPVIIRSWIPCNFPKRRCLANARAAKAARVRNSRSQLAWASLQSRSLIQWTIQNHFMRRTDQANLTDYQTMLLWDSMMVYWLYKWLSLKTTLLGKRLDFQCNGCIQLRQQATFDTPGGYASASAAAFAAFKHTINNQTAQEQSHRQTSKICRMSRHGHQKRRVQSWFSNVSMAPLFPCLKFNFHGYANVCVCDAQLAVPKYIKKN